MVGHFDDLQEEYERFADLAKQHFDVSQFYFEIVREQLSLMNEIEGAIDSDLTIQNLFENINVHLLKTEKYMKKAVRNLRTEFISDEDQ